MSFNDKQLYYIKNHLQKEPLDKYCIHHCAFLVCIEKKEIIIRISSCRLKTSYDDFHLLYSITQKCHYYPLVFFKSIGKSCFTMCSLNIINLISLNYLLCLFYFIKLNMIFRIIGRKFKAFN